MIQLSPASCDPVKPPNQPEFDPNPRVRVIMKETGVGEVVRQDEFDIQTMFRLGSAIMQRPTSDPQDTDYYDLTVCRD